MMTRLTSTNTAWRDRYGQAWRWSLALTALLHLTLFFWLPGALVDRLHEALIPSPTVFVTAGSGGAEMEVVALGGAASLEAPVEEPAEEAVEEVETPVPVESAPEETTIAPTTEAPSAGEAADAGTGAAAEGEGPGTGAGGSGGIASPRPLHLVVPRLPGGVDRRRAHGETVHLLVEVLPDGTVGEVRVEKGSRIAALDQAAMSAARQMRYVPAMRGGEGITQWTRTEMRF
jgi:protein TonB